MSRRKGKAEQMDYAKETRRQYLKYFRVWFMILGAALLLFLAEIGWRGLAGGSKERTNLEAPAERVYDDADVLTDEEEQLLREQIAKAEAKLKMDIVIVTINQSVEGAEAREQYGYDSGIWEYNMRDLADDFWDERRYGYNKGYEGDGVLLLHNWYPGQNGEHMSTSGKAERELSSSEIDEILNVVDRYYDSDPYKAYSRFVEKVESMLSHNGTAPLPWLLVIVGPVVVAFIYMLCSMSHFKAKDTTPVNAYVMGGKPVINSQSDQFLRKNVSHHHINTGSSGGSGGHSSGGGGGHHSSHSGASHGGGSHRH